MRRLDHRRAATKCNVPGGEKGARRAPADHCLGLDHDKGVLPPCSQAGKEDPEHAVERMKPQPWSFPIPNRHLLAESDVFQPYRLAAQGDFAHQGNEDHDDRLHVADG